MPRSIAGLPEEGIVLVPWHTLYATIWMNPQTDLAGTNDPVHVNFVFAWRQLVALSKSEPSGEGSHLPLFPQPRVLYAPDLADPRTFSNLSDPNADHLRI